MDIIITVGNKQVMAVAKRITANGAAIIYTSSGPVEIPHGRWQVVGAGGIIGESVWTDGFGGG